MNFLFVEIRRRTLMGIVRNYKWRRTDLHRKPFTVGVPQPFV